MLSMNGSYKHTILSRRPFNTFAEFSSNNLSSRWPGIRTHNSASPQPHASPHNRHLAFRCLKSAFKSIAYWAMALYQFLTYLLKKQVRAVSISSITNYYQCNIIYDYLDSKVATCSI